MTGEEVPLKTSTAVRVLGPRKGHALQAVTCAESWRERRHKPKHDAGDASNGRVSAANTQPAHRSLSIAWGGVQAGQHDQHQHLHAAPMPTWHAGPSGCADLTSRSRPLPQRTPTTRPAPSGASREHAGCAARGRPSARHPGTHGQPTASPSVHTQPTQDTKPLAPWAWTSCVTKKKKEKRGEPVHPSSTAPWTPVCESQGRLSPLPSPLPSFDHLLPFPPPPLTSPHRSQGRPTVAAAAAPTTAQLSQTSGT